MKQVFWTIMKKELLIAMRGGKLQVLGPIVFPTIMQWVLLGNSLKLGAFAGQNSDQVPMGPTLTLVYVPLLLIPLIGNGLLVRSFAQERLTGALMSILATGMNVGVLWAMKTLSVFIYCFLVSLLVLEFDVLLMTYVLHVPVVVSFSTVILILVAAPIAALALTAVVSFIYWVAKRASFLASFLPVTSVVLLYFYGVSNPTPARMLSAAGAAVLVAATALLACGYTITKISKARILGL